MGALSFNGRTTGESKTGYWSRPTIRRSGILSLYFPVCGNAICVSLMPEKSRVLIVDDHPIVRAGVRLALRGHPTLEICGEADSVNAALTLAEQQKPDALVLDLHLGGRDGIEMVGRMRELLPHAKILVFSMNSEDLFAKRALRAGANGYLMKEGGLEELQHALGRILAGEVYVSQRMNSRLLNSVARGDSEDDPLSELTDREMQIFLLLGGGKTTGQIADELSLSVKTISTHRENLKTKLGVDSAAELVRKAVAYVVGSGRKA
jgi:DNA-binding NarL/FixJ family response regulator